MVPQKHLAVSANTTQVFSLEHRGICTALRCEANTSAFLPKGKHPSPPSLWHKETVSDMDADTPLGRPLQNECATRPCVADRHAAVRSACWSLTLAAGEFAAAKTTLNLPMAASAKARLYIRRVPGPGPSLCAKTKARLYTRGMPGPGPSLSSSTCPTLLCVGARLVHTSEFSRGEMGAGTTSFHFKRLYRPRSRRGRSRQEPKENKSRGGSRLWCARRW
jgi:hypothetical protein